MECIEMMALDAINNGCGDVGSQDYKWANVVIDEETGNVMDFKKLLNHQKICRTMVKSSIKQI